VEMKHGVVRWNHAMIFIFYPLFPEGVFGGVEFLDFFAVRLTSA
jgi:hypothetical protein